MCFTSGRSASAACLRPAVHLIRYHHPHAMRPVVKRAREQIIRFKVSAIESREAVVFWPIIRWTVGWQSEKRMSHLRDLEYPNTFAARYWETWGLSALLPVFT